MWPTLARSLRRGRPSFRSVTSLSEHSVDGDVGSASPISGPSTWRGVARFYKTTEAVACPSGGGWRVLIDGRPLRTNTAGELLLPSEDLAWAIAAEFASQGDMIVPATTSLYNLASTAVDTYVTEDLAGAEDYEAFLRAQRLSTFDLLVERQAAATPPTPPRTPSWPLRAACRAPRPPTRTSPRGAKAAAQ